MIFITCSLANIQAPAVNKVQLPDTHYERSRDPSLCVVVANRPLLLPPPHLGPSQGEARGGAQRQGPPMSLQRAEGWGPG